MCGIAGLISTLGASETLAPDPVRRMTARMHTRSPDAEGLWSHAFGLRIPGQGDAGAVAQEALAGSSLECSKTGLGGMVV